MDEMQQQTHNTTFMDNKLQFLDILDEALVIFFNSIKFIISAALASFPFFCFLVFYELLLQRAFLETSNILEKLSYDPWLEGMPFENTKIITRILCPKLLQLFLLYLGPYHLLEFFTITMVVDIASKFYAGEELGSFKAMVKKPFNNIARLKGSLITSFYVLLLSTSGLLGLIWVVANFFILTKGFRWGSIYYYYHYDYYYYSPGDMVLYGLIMVFHGMAFCALLMKYVEWSAGWNVSLVIAIVDGEVYGSEAFDLAGYFSRGSKGKGSALMLFFFLWGLILRLPCLFGGCYVKMGGTVFTFVYAGLICAGNVMKWVVCVVYFFDCKKRILEKKFDEEIGEMREANAE